MTNARKFISRHLVFEIVVFAALSLSFWMVTRVLPNGELSETGYKAALFLEKAELYLGGMFGAQAAQPVGPSNTRTWYEITMFKGFCGLASFASVYVKNSSVLSYFIVIPAFLIIIFAYNRAGPDSFSRSSRVVFSLTLISMIFVVTFKVIELQEVQGTIISLSPENFLSEEHNYRCDKEVDGQNGDSSIASLALFLGNVSAFLSELRLYLLGLVLWIIGKEHADIRKMQKAAAMPRRQNAGGKNEETHS